MRREVLSDKMAINQSTDALLFFMTHKDIFVSVVIRKIRQAISFMNWNSILENPSIDPLHIHSRIRSSPKINFGGTVQVKLLAC